MPSRRAFLAATTAALATPFLRPLAPLTGGPARPAPPAIRPPRLRPGSTLGLVSPAGATFFEPDLQEVEATLAALGFGTRRGAHALDTYGYLGGRDADRAADLMDMFLDPGVHGILPLRGGWGCARLLPFLDFEAIRAHPKVLCGYSDVTALLAALYAQSGLVAFHGPVATSTWNDFSAGHWTRTLVEAQPPVLQDPPGADREVITPGIARGPLFGGNLTVIAALVGTAFVPDLAGHILFLEDVGEEPYRIDRMLTQLGLAGLLDRLAGVYFGDCKNCEPEEGAKSLTLSQVLRDHFAPLGIPAWRSHLVGHMVDKYTLPIGVEAEMDAAAGTIRVLAPAVR